MKLSFASIDYRTVISVPLISNSITKLEIRKLITKAAIDADLVHGLTG